jgi:hypothetical protein
MYVKCYYFKIKKNKEIKVYIIMSEEEKHLISFKNIIKNLEEKYKKTPNIINKLNNYLIDGLDKHLEQFCIKENKKYLNNLETCAMREERKSQLINYQEEFLTKFLYIYKYFYINSTDFFISYDSENFKVEKEDDILYKILSSISQDENLKPWKYKIKISAIKKIKESTILNLIPERFTIQKCINLLLSINIFNTKEETKYFLIIIGDLILKKNDNLIYLISILGKNFIKILSDQCYFYFGININNSIKFKYHEQLNHNDYRLLKINKKINDLSEINKECLNILCVAIHYSKRYKSAEDYLESEVSEDLSNFSLYLKNKSIDIITNEFINKNLIKIDGNSISQKNMLYLWKSYLEENNLPSLIFQNTLKNKLKECLNYNEEKEIYNNVFSESLPIVSQFQEFWDKNIIEEEDELGIEISEIKHLFKTNYNLKVKIQEDFIINIIKHFYQEIIIVDDKHILNISCILWNKRDEINKFLEETKNLFINNNEKYPISIDYLYDKYSQNNKKNTSIIKKSYFEKYVIEYLNNYLDDNRLISNLWWNNN